MSDLLRDRVQAIQKLAEAATPGEWGWRYYDGFISLEAFDENGESTADVIRAADPETETNGPFLGWVNVSRADAKFIEEARETVPWLAARLLEALDTIDKARELHQPEDWGMSGLFCRHCEHPWPCPTQRRQRMSTGVELIAAERKRQIEDEGRTPEHDDPHTRGHLAWAAACYAAPETIYRVEVTDSPGRGGRARQVEVATWEPWPLGWHRPECGRVRELVKAGALIAAEIDRLQRLDPKDNTDG